MAITLTEAVNQVVDAIDGIIKIGLPLGAGKPNAFINALYQHACSDSSIELEIYTALSLGRPTASSSLEKRFLEPFVERVFDGFEELDYLSAVRSQSLPDNIRVYELFFAPASMLANDTAQQHYINSNYTHMARDLMARGVNVLAQVVSPNPANAEHVSLSCNPELILDLVPMVEARRERGETVLIVGQVHPELPYMGNDAEVNKSLFDILIEDEAANTALFVTPNMPVSLQDHLIGLHASSLLKDGGTIQIGIGALGDAIVHHLINRQYRNDAYGQLLDDLGIVNKQRSLIEAEGGVGPFEEGLYGCSEMVTEGLLELFLQGIITRAVDGDICLHGGFYLGSAAFYKKLRELSDHQRQQICMTHISFVNGLYGQEDLKRQQRQHARFINTVFTATLLGASAADQLENGRALSGVGGQYNFVAQAHELENARSMLLLRAWRERAGEASSNLVWSYGHNTIPRHLRDIYITEYGIADLRGKPDNEVVAAMLNISDSRFQASLLAQAQAAGKISADYVVPEQYRYNLPDVLAQKVHNSAEDLMPDFPLGSDFDETEQALLKALTWLKEKVSKKAYLSLGREVFQELVQEHDYQPYLERMQLHAPVGLKEHLGNKLLSAALANTLPK